jgi:fumarate reductase subunit C
MLLFLKNKFLCYFGTILLTIPNLFIFIHFKKNELDQKLFLTRLNFLQNLIIINLKMILFDFKYLEKKTFFEDLLTNLKLL